MDEKIKTICLILITVAIIVGTVFYCWEIWKEQKYYLQKQECIEKCCSTNKNIIQDSSDRLKTCKELCNYDFIQSKIISD